MKGKWYRSYGTKGALFLGLYLCLVYFIFSTYQVSRFPNLVSDVFQGKLEEEYANSTSFEVDLELQSIDILNGIEGKALLERAKDKEQNQIDVAKYFSGKGDDLFYTTEEFIEWANTYRQTEEIEEELPPFIVCKKIDGSYFYLPYGEFVSRIHKKEWTIQMDSLEETEELKTNQKIVDLLDRAENLQIFDEEKQLLFTNCWGYDGTFLKERYAPKGYTDLLDFANRNPKWNGRLQEAYELLEGSLNRLQEDLELAKQLESSWKEGNTNITYLFFNPKTKEIYTNATNGSQGKTGEETLEKIQNMERYLMVSEELKDFRTNLKYARATKWMDLLGTYQTKEGGSIFAIGIDTRYPIGDIFYQNHRDYQRHFHYAWRFVISGMVLLLYGSIAFVWLTLVAGRKRGDEELHFLWMDRIPIEITLGGMLCLMIFGSFVANIFLSTGVLDLFVWIVLLPFFLGLLFLGYLSVVRSIKGRRVWRQSLLYRMKNLIQRLLAHINQIWKDILWLAFLVVLHAILLGFRTGFLFFIFVVLVDILSVVFFLQKEVGVVAIQKGIRELSQGNLNYKIPMQGLSKEQAQMAGSINSIGDGFEKVLADNIKSEKMKTELIANVSHDIKTPLTSIINYVGLLKQEDFSDSKIQKYIEVIEKKSQQLKALTEDVVEASRVTSGAITLEKMNLNLAELLQQVSGEFEERFQKRELKEILEIQQKEVVACVDGKRIWRVFENLYGNVEKYSLESSRIYTELKKEGERIQFCMKNVSKYPLNMDADELTERFIRGDLSRSTEGSGLGLSIAKSIIELHGGKMELQIDGDLFKVTIEL